MIAFTVLNEILMGFCCGLLFLLLNEIYQLFHVVVKLLDLDTFYCAYDLSLK